MTNFVIAIPARLGSTRLPEKPLHLIAGKPLVAHVIECAHAARAQQVVVATDHEHVAAVATEYNAEFCLTQTTHESGTDRLVEVCQKMGWDDNMIVVNLQGDEPLAPASAIRAVAELLDTHPRMPMATLASPLTSIEEFLSPHCVKVVCNHLQQALYFSRGSIPWPRDHFMRNQNSLPENHPFMRHIGIYAYRVGFLKKFPQLPPSNLEKIESLEQLRVLEAGFPIQVGITPAPFLGCVDTYEDARQVEKIILQL